MRLVCFHQVFSDRSNGVTTPIELSGGDDAQMFAKQMIEELCSQEYSGET